MFDVPSNSKIEKCIITKQTVLSHEQPKLVINENKEQKTTTKKKRKKVIDKNKQSA